MTLNTIDLSTLNTPSQGITVTSSATSAFNGFSLGVLDDINNDQYDDFVIAEVNAQKLYVIFGGPNLNNINLATFSNSQGFIISCNPSSSCAGIGGRSVDSAGDFNGDGYNDIIFEIPGASNTVIVVYGA